MDRVYPLIAVPGMGLFIPEDNPLAAVRVETPSIAVGRLSGPRLPGPLQRSPPSGVKQLMAGGGIILLGTTLIPLLSGLF